MRTLCRLAACCLVSLLIALSPAVAAASGKDKPMSDKALTHAIARWLVLGPVPDALPLFHEEDRGRYGVEDLLKADRGPSPRARPAAGETVAWPVGVAPAWTGAAIKDGRVELPTAATHEGKGYAAVWLASYVAVDRFQVFDVSVDGTHPRRLWIDGEPIASGGIVKDGKPSEATGTVKLEQGTHLVVVETIYEPAHGTAWSAGATLSIAKAPASGLPVVSDGVERRRDVTLADVLDAPQMSSVAISPDGGMVAVGLSRVVSGSDDTESWVELRSATDGTLLRSWRGGSAIGQIEWAPTGKRLSYAARDRRDAGKESTTLWVVDLDTNAVTAVVERVENFAGYRWAPDSASIVYSVTAKPEPDKRGVKLREGLLDRQSDWRDRSFLYQVALPGGATRRLTAGGLATSSSGFSPDGKRLLVVREVEDVADRPYTRKELWELDLSTLYGKKLHDSRWLADAQYAPDGRRLLLVAGPSEFGDLGRSIPQGMTPNETDGQLYVLDPPTGGVEALSRGFDPAIQAAHWSRFDGTIYVKAAVKDGTGIFRYDATGKTFTRLDAGGELVSSISFAEGAAVASCTVDGPWTAESLVAVDLHGGPARRLLSPAAAAMAEVTVGTVAGASYTASDGAPVDGRIYFPPGFEPGARSKYPAIVYYYGGVLPVTPEFGGRYPKEWWAAHGYVVYVPEPSGAIGYGQARSAVHVNDWGRVAADEILDATRAFLAANPAVDPKRVGAIGASYGGFMTMLLVTKTDMFAAAVSHAGISNIASYWGEGNWGYSYGALSAAGSFPWNRKDLFVDRSPLYAADKVKTPLLLTHGAVDSNVPPGESESFYTALKLLGAEVELLTVDGQDHHVLDHAKRSLWSRSILAWFDRWLKGQPAWWDDLYPKTQLK
jgi:dipeptidyl aminopeptidase/acylaminoacyl peptidase